MASWTACRSIRYLRVFWLLLLASPISNIAVMNALGRGGYESTY